MSIPPVDKATATNLFTNPDNDSSGEVVVWENFVSDPRLENVAPSENEHWRRTPLPGGGVEIEAKSFTSTSNVFVPPYSTFPLPWSTMYAGYEVENTSYFPLSLRIEVYTGPPPTGDEYLPPVTSTIIPPGETANITRIVSGYEGEGYFQPRIARVPETSFPTGAKFVIRKLWAMPVAAPIPYFDEAFSPDPDLTPQPRPGGGSQLVGQQVSGLTPYGGVVVQSEQWSKSGGRSARLIRNVESGNTSIIMVGQHSAQTVAVWRYQNTKFESVSSAWFGAVSFGSSSPETSDMVRAENEPGETLLRVHRDINSTGTVLLAGHFSDIGESVWFDLITITDDPYDGPPFSPNISPFEYKGQTVYPQWDGEPNNSTTSFEYYFALDPWTPNPGWDQPHQRLFEIGVDRGMLYPLDGPGVPWNGLRSFTINNEGSQMESHYVDGVMFDMDVPMSDFSATIEAYTYPEEFEECVGSPKYDGIDSLTIHGQKPKPFGLSFRTLIGDGNEGVDLGYKIHLVYGAYATPAAGAYGTIEAMPSASTFSWNIKALPQLVPGFRPTSYFTIDSTKVHPIVLDAIESVLYGAYSVPPELPPISVIVSYLNEY